MVKILDVSAILIAIPVVFMYWQNFVNAKAALISSVDKISLWQREKTDPRYENAIYRRAAKMLKENNNTYTTTHGKFGKEFNELESDVSQGQTDMGKGKTKIVSKQKKFKSTKNKGQNKNKGNENNQSSNFQAYSHTHKASDQILVITLKRRNNLYINRTAIQYRQLRLQKEQNKKKMNRKQYKAIALFNKSYIRSSRLNTKNKILPGFNKISILWDLLRQNEEVTVTETQAEIFDEFVSPYAIIPQMMRILKHFPNVNVSSSVLARTVEYNNIVLFKIAAAPQNETEQTQTKEPSGGERTNTANFEGKYIDEPPEKKIIFIVHGLTVMGLNGLSCLTEEDKLKRLIGYYLAYLEIFDIFLIPIANPDGYVATRSKTGVYWNKNKSPQKDCNGVMLDRNFDVAWNSSVNISSCSQAYPGPSPFSEAESRAIRDVIHYHGHRIIAYIHVHAGTYDTNAFKGDAVLYPRGYTDSPLDEDKYLDIKGDIEETMKNASFQVVSVAVDSLYNWYGRVFGSSVDYAAAVYGIPFAMEFVMQLYASSMFASEDEDLVDYTALTQIWQRVINVTFSYMAKFTQNPMDFE